MSYRDQITHVANVSRQVHFTLSSVFSLYAMFILEEDYKRWLFAPTKREMVYYRFNSYSVTFTIAYWFHDFYFIGFVRAENTKTDIQLLYHHAIGSMLLLFCILTGGIITKVAHFTLTCEISNVFITHRDIMGKHDWKGTAANICNMLFFLTYTIFRVMLFPVIIYTTVK